MLLAGFVKIAIPALGGVASTFTNRASDNGEYSPTLYTNSYYLLSTYATTALFGFGFWVIAARLYAPVDVGLGATLISTAMLLSMLSSLGMQYALVRFLPAAGDNAAKMITSSFLLIAGLAAIITLIFLIGMGVWAPSLRSISDQPAYLLCLVLFTISAALSPPLFHAFVASRRAGYVFALNGLGNLLKVTLLVLLPMLAGNIGIFAAWGISMLVPLVVGIIGGLARVYTGYSFRFSFDRDSISRMLPFSLANYVGELALFSSSAGLLAWILPVLVANLLGFEQNAYFYVVWSIIGVLNSIPVAVGTSLFAEGCHAEDAITQITGRSLRLALVLLLPAVTALFFLGPTLLAVFGQAYYENAANLLRVLSLTAFPTAFNVLSLNILRVKKNIKAILASSALIATATLLLAYFCTLWWGIIGSGLAWGLTQSGTAIVMALTVWGVLERRKSLLSLFR